MIDHIGIAVADFDRSLTFYTAALAPLGLFVVRQERNTLGNRTALVGDGEVVFTFAESEAVSPAIHIAFAARSAEQVDAFHRAAVLAGGRDNGAPGLRTAYDKDYYAAFVLDPDGMNIEAVCHLERGNANLHHRL